MTEKLEQIVTPLEHRLRAFTDAYAIRSGTDPEKTFTDLKTFMDSDRVLALDLHNAVVYLSCEDPQKVTYERFCTLLVGDPDIS